MESLSAVTAQTNTPASWNEARLAMGGDGKKEGEEKNPKKGGISGKGKGRPTIVLHLGGEMTDDKIVRI